MGHKNSNSISTLNFNQIAQRKGSKTK